MRLITDARNWFPFLIVLAALLLWLGRIRPFPARADLRGKKFNLLNPRVVLICIVFSVAFSDQLSYQIKHHVSRSRPCRDEVVATEIETRVHVSGNRSFPSSHAANSAALATVVGLAHPPIALLAALLSFAVGFSRIYLGVHYPLDVVTGWAIGVASGLGFWILLRKALRKGGLIGFVNRFRFRQPRPGADPGPPWRPLEFQSADGFALTGFLLEMEGSTGLAILIHGLGEDLSGLRDLGKLFYEKGYSVLLVPLRGHDAHPSNLPTGGPGEANDVLGALSAAKDLGISMRNTIVYGSSMGGDAAILAAARSTPEPPGGVICHGAYSDFFSAAARRMGRFPAIVLKLLLPGGVVRGLCSFVPEESIRICGDRTSFVFIFGSKDRVCPPGTGVDLLGAASRGMLITVEGFMHPSELTGRMDVSLMAKAVDASIEFITGKLSAENLVLDESGNLHIVPVIQKPC
jgi:undecaprenyl-diphosphatase